VPPQSDDARATPPHDSDLALIPEGDSPMRAAAYLSAAVIAIGTYLAIASTLTFSTSWIAIGILAIAVLAAVAVMTTEGAGSSRTLSPTDR